MYQGKGGSYELESTENEILAAHPSIFFDFQFSPLKIQIITKFKPCHFLNFINQTDIYIFIAIKDYL